MATTTSDWPRSAPTPRRRPLSGPTSRTTRDQGLGERELEGQGLALGEVGARATRSPAEMLGGVGKELSRAGGYSTPLRREAHEGGSAAAGDRPRLLSCLWHASRLSLTTCFFGSALHISRDRSLPWGSGGGQEKGSRGSGTEAAVPRGRRGRQAARASGRRATVQRSGVQRSGRRRARRRGIQELGDPLRISRFSSVLTMYPAARPACERAARPRPRRRRGRSSRAWWRSCAAPRRS
jgi:hypothetical protein